MGLLSTPCSRGLTTVRLVLFYAPHVLSASEAGRCAVWLQPSSWLAAAAALLDDDLADCNALMGALADADANDDRRNIDEIFAYVDAFALRRSSVMGLRGCA